MTDHQKRIDEIQEEMSGAMNSALWEYAPMEVIDELIAMVPNQVSIGWVAVTETGEVHQSDVSNAYQNMFGRGGKTRKSVRKIYATEGKAAQYSPVKKAKEVFISL